MGEELPEEPAEPGGHPEQHALPLPACFGDVRWRNDQVAPVEWGMSLQQFNDFVAACRATDYWPVAAQKGHVNLYEVVEFFVKPWTRRTGCSVALRMNSAPARAELMVSHSWQECMDQCSEALGKFCARHKQIASSLAVALWFCAFAQYQPGSEPGDRGPTVAEQLALDPFGSVIRSLRDGLGMVVVQTSMGDVYSRLWCVYEISEAAFLPPAPPWRPNRATQRDGAAARRREWAKPAEGAESGRSEVNRKTGHGDIPSKLWTGEQPSAEDVQRASWTDKGFSGHALQGLRSGGSELEKGLKSFKCFQDLDVTFALSLATGTFDSYVKAAPAAQPPDCVSYNTQGACCPSLACYKDLPLGVKIYVTILLLLAMRGGVRMITEARSQAVRE
ncbi:Hypothetical protein (Fragment) [Durusdinium trenchii]|uniref:Uncharacterized protein n=1 Tax=Durusdinium trenchii TaxID=1381693 RepID=A0ABP0IM08_9DINO